MNHASTAPPSTEGASREEYLSALFAQLVMQQSNMAMMLMGKVAHPETGKTVEDFEGARLFIDELEMLEAKTKGNLSKEEASLLKQALMTLRLAFVENVESSTTAKPASSPQPQPEQKQAPEPAADATTQAPYEEEEHRKKFSKKY